ncbi:MAG: ATP-binding protein [Pseudomonadota bacterium]
MSQGGSNKAQGATPERDGPSVSRPLGLARRGMHERARVTAIAIGTVSGLVACWCTFALIGQAASSPALETCIITGWALTAWCALSVALLDLGTSSDAKRGQIVEPTTPEADPDDLEALKDAAWELREREARYRDLLDSQSDLIYRRDQAGRVTYANRAFAQTFGLDGADLIGRRFEPPILAENTTALVNGDDGHLHQRTTLHDTIDGERWIEWRIQTLTTGSPAPRPTAATSAPSARSATAAAPAPDRAIALGIETQHVGRDVTATLQAQHRLEDAQRRADAANRAKSRFLASMSHEIRTPMNGILGMTELLLDTPVNAEQRTYARAIDSSGRVLMELIDEILDFSKIEAGKLALDAVPFSLETCIQDVVELLSAKAGEKQLELAWAIEPTLPTILIGDEVRLRQILMNLIGNAVKFTTSGGILVRASRARATAAIRPRHRLALTIAIEDTGIGLSREAIDRVFEEFEQADHGPSHQGGTGLGLAISRRLARAMDGDIRIESEPDVGSTFSLDISLLVGEHHSAAKLAPGAQHHILLAINRPIERRALRLVLDGLGLAVEDAAPEHAPALISDAAHNELPFDTLITDVEDGLEAARARLALAKEAAGDRLRALVLIDPSGRTRFPALRRAGFQGYLVRPIRPHTLLVQLQRPAGPDQTVRRDDLTATHGGDAVAAGSQGKSTKPKHDAAPARPPLLEAPSPNALRPEAARSVRQAPHVLLAEDNDINAMLADHMLRKAGCTVTPAADGREALGAVRALLTRESDAFDLILMDIHMPELNGFEAADAIRALFRETPALDRPPIVALTANAFAEDRARCMAAGFDDYAAKPVMQETLLALLRDHCRYVPAVPLRAPQPLREASTA